MSAGLFLNVDCILQLSVVTWPAMDLEKLAFFSTFALSTICTYSARFSLYSNMNI